MVHAAAEPKKRASKTKGWGIPLPEPNPARPDGMSHLYRRLPWAGYKASPRTIGFDKRTWIFNPDTGLQLRDDEFDFTPGSRGVQKVVERTGARDQVNGFEVILDKQQVARLFVISHENEITLAEALVEMLGEDQVSPAWIERAKEGIPYRAHPDYERPARG